MPNKTHWSPLKVARAPSHYSKTWKIKGKKSSTSIYFSLAIQLCNQIVDEQKFFLTEEFQLINAE